MRHILLFVLLVFSLHTQAATLKAKNSAELLSALSKAKGGDIIKLAKGNYSAISLNGTTKANKYISSYSSEVIIESELTAQPAVLSNLRMLAGKNITFRNLTFQSTTTAEKSRLIDLGLVTNIKFIGVKVLGKKLGAYGTGYGLWVGSSSSGLRIENSVFDSFDNGLNIYAVNGLTIIDSDLTNMSHDVLQIGYVNNVLIENNLMTKKSNPNGDAHQDLIQVIHASSSNTPASNITIRGNRLEAPDAMTHGIYVESGVAKASNKKSDCFKTIVIENNDIMTSQALGLVVGNTIGVLIRGNELIQHSGARSNSPVRIPQIRVGNTSENVTVSQNRGPLAPTATTTVNWTPTSIPSGKGWVFSSNVVTGN